MSLSIVGQQIKTSLVGDYDYWKMDYKKKGERLTRLTEYTFSSSFLETRVNNYLFQKYASSQNYYYTRDINDMLSDSRSGPSFIIRDTMAYFEVINLIIMRLKNTSTGYTNLKSMTIR